MFKQIVLRIVWEVWSLMVLKNINMSIRFIVCRMLFHEKNWMPLIRE